MPLTTAKPNYPVLPKPENPKKGICQSLSLNAIEDKELRKKLRNRQSALAARERKKARMLELERKVMALQESHKRLEHENHFLYSRLNLMKQKCLEAGVTLGNDKDPLSMHPVNSFHSRSVNDVYSNNYNLILDQTRRYAGPSRPDSLQSFNNIPVDYAANNLSQNSHNHQYFADSLNCYRKSMESNETQGFPNKADQHRKTNLADPNRAAFCEKSYHSQNKFELNSDRPSIKQEINQVSEFFESKDNFCTTLEQTLNLFSPNHTPSTSNSAQLNLTQSCAQEMSPSNSLPSIDAMLESNANRPPVTIESVAQSDLERTFATQRPGNCKQRIHHNAKRRNESVSSIVKRSKSFHSVSVMSPTFEASFCEWPKPVLQNRFSNPTNVKTLTCKTKKQFNFDLLPSTEGRKISNDFSAYFESHISPNAKAHDLANSASKCRPNDHSASDSGLSMDEHLDWVNDSTLFDF